MRCARVHANGAWRCVTWLSPATLVTTRGYFTTHQYRVKQEYTKPQILTKSLKNISNICYCFIVHLYIEAVCYASIRLTRYFNSTTKFNVKRNKRSDSIHLFFRRLAEPKIYLICRIMQTETCLSLFLAFRFHIRVK